MSLRASTRKDEKHRKDSAPNMATLAHAVVAANKLKKGAAVKPKSVVVRTQTWEVVAPPPVTSLKGVLVPHAFATRGRRRKISIEVHRIDATDGRGSYEVCIVRVLNPSTNEELEASKNRAKEKKKIFRLVNHHHASGIGADGLPVLEEDIDVGDGDDESTVGHPGMMDPASMNYTMPNFGGWEEKYRFPIRNIHIKGTIRSGVFVQVTLGRVCQRRQLIFDTIEEAEEFREAVHEQLALENERNDRKLKVIFYGKPPPKQEEITFLVEVVSGWDLPIGDLSSSDPYVICCFNGVDVHKTQRINNTLDPIWTVKTGSLFLFNVEAETLFLSEGLFFQVNDYDAMGKHEVLGCFVVAPSVVYEATGDRLPFKLLPGEGSKKKEVPGYVAIRIRRATKYDIDFMNEHVYKDLRKGGYNEMEKATDQFGGMGALKSYLKRQTRMITLDDYAGTEVKQYKVRPGPDPKREDETTWMTKHAIEREHKKESHHWVDIGSGQLGRLYVEVLGCDELPNLDTGGRNKTDAFVALVYEDAFVKTDVVDDCLNPRWLPWSKRAAIFHIHHSSSALYLGVFDFDRGSDHDLVGRVSVDLTNLRKDTVYVLTYGIYTTSRISDRKRKGCVTIRLRIEIEDDRQVLLSNLEPPPEFYVNVKTRKDFRVVNYTCTGKYDVKKYDIRYINSYIEEILTTQQALFYLNDAVMNLLLWRGTFPLKILGKTIRLPVHSFSAFVSLALVVERPQLAPSWFFAVIGWIMIATMDYRLHIPNPWLRCKHFGEFVITLITGESPHPPESIKRNENAEEAAAFDARLRKRIADAEAAAAIEYQENMKAQQELEKEMEDIGDTTADLSANGSGGFSVDPFKAVLFPVQQNLAMVCRYIRHARYIVFWEECFISFWFTTGCFLVSIIFLFIPWFFLLKWGSRILVWTFLGPWMKLVDVFYVSKIKELSEEEMDRKMIDAREKRRLAAAEAISEARIKKEKAVKLKAMKTYMFGKYISRVPVLKEDRYVDTPLAESYAYPYTPELKPLSEVAMQEAGYHRTRLPGQHLVGDMIPRMETVGFTDAAIGQPVRNRKLVDRAAWAGILSGGPESTLQAYMKIGSLLMVSLVISWFAVPFLSGLIDKLLLELLPRQAAL